ncbi:putative toxin-antitoxin system toxin component, PIN family [Thermococcus sp. SY098]|uniref:putative toxin-antitoxin system toxin component, PIN family n=1 Tax=Thermococcus sp. SY098 TaxID=3111325 RepID=UPI002D7722BF|nr:putative toxin-antitoxin system toxin component, PIN family [Thermococcus sp. SY098]WRS52157.1 putative toxin-antitoxin system toxin component, PIN family [Thermococcus sp. SY098]
MEPRVVIDTNVVISAAINPKGKPGKIIDMIMNGEIVSYTSQEILEELGFKLLSEKVLKYIGDASIALDLLLSFSTMSIIVEPKVHFNVSPDTDDNKFFDVVYEAKADYLISGNIRDIINLRNKDREFKLGTHKFKILTPKEFIEDFPTI